MTINQHHHNLQRIERFLQTASALGVNTTNPDMLHELLMMTLSDNKTSDADIRTYLDKWDILRKWDEYQATIQVLDILDYRLS
jgi:hypothetical protein